jgi:hypothetical protein
LDRCTARVGVRVSRVGFLAKPQRELPPSPLQRGHHRKRERDERGKSMGGGVGRGMNPTKKRIVERDDNNNAGDDDDDQNFTVVVIAAAASAEAEATSVV